MSLPPIYLDHNSTTPIDPRVVQAMTRVWTECGANPASQHSLGRKARRILEEARDAIAELLGAKAGSMDADQVILTSGGTEANNLALIGITSATPSERIVFFTGKLSGPGDDVLISNVEHPSVVAAGVELKRRGLEVHAGIATYQDGCLCDRFVECLDMQPRLVSVMLANNETGMIHPIAELAAACRERGILIHTDAVQAVGKIPVNFRELRVDAMTVAPHKFHGPRGIGALVVRHGVKLEPQLFGGFQQGGLRPGTENVALAVGFYQALKFAIDELEVRSAHMRSLRNEMEAALRAECREMVVIGADAPRLPNTSCIAFPGLDRQQLVMALDLAGVACSTGSACASGSSEPSPTLIAMGLPEAVIRGAIRLSLGAFTTTAEITEAARRIINTVRHLQSQK